MTRSIFTYELRGPVVLLVEHDGPRSIAHDAEKVIEELAEDGLDLEGRRFIYRDELGL